MPLAGGQRKKYPNQSQTTQHVAERQSLEHIEAFASYFNTLKRIHVRLACEGYEVVEGRITPPSTTRN